MDKKHTCKEYESPWTGRLILNNEGLLCASVPGSIDYMPSDDIGDVFGW